GHLSPYQLDENEVVRSLRDLVRRQLTLAFLVQRLSKDGVIRPRYAVFLEAREYVFEVLARKSAHPHPPSRSLKSSAPASPRQPLNDSPKMAFIHAPSHGHSSGRVCS